MSSMADVNFALNKAFERKGGGTKRKRNALIDGDNGVEATAAIVAAAASPATSPGAATNENAVGTSQASAVEINDDVLVVANPALAGNSQGNPIDVLSDSDAEGNDTNSAVAAVTKKAKKAKKGQKSRSRKTTVPTEKPPTEKQVKKANDKYNRAARLGTEEGSAKARTPADPEPPVVAGPVLPPLVQAPSVSPVGSNAALGQQVNNPDVSAPTSEVHYLVPASTPAQAHPSNYLLDEPKAKGKSQKDSKITRGAKPGDIGGM